MNTLIKPQKLRKPKPNLIKHYTALKKSISYSIIVGSLLMPSIIMAKGSNSTETRLLINQMEEYKRQLEVTNQRLKELEQKETIKATSTHNGNGLDEVNGNGNGNKITHNTPTAEARNVQDEPDVEDPKKAGVPKSRYLKGFYDNGFVLRTQDNRYSIGINGLVQARYTLQLPNANAGNSSQNFDLALGRLFFSGTVFDPNLSYFFFYQTSTLNNNNRVDTIDWWAKYKMGDFGIKAGRILPQYSRQFYTDIGKYLFMDLQQPEYAFSLQRTPGVEASWSSGKWTASLTAGNSIRALDSSTQANTNLKLAGVGRIKYDILAPYNYVQETVPDIVETPELSVGAAFGYNPIDAASALQNTVVGMDTYNGTLDIGYRYKLFSTEAALFGRQNYLAQGTTPGFVTGTSKDYGWYWQTGYYLLPKRLELAGLANQVVFDHQYYSNYKKQTVGSVGLNYYFYEHNFKLQTDYSYITGEDWNNNSRFA